MRALALALAALVLAGPAAASEERPTASELESELVCPVCETTLDTSNAPVALRMKAFIRARAKVEGLISWPWSCSGATLLGRRRPPLASSPCVSSRRMWHLMSSPPDPQHGS